MQGIPRGEYPRPSFYREHWQSLNGIWEFSFDEPSFDQNIIVPFVYESELSGIGRSDFHDIVWYRKQVMIDKRFSDKRVLLHFGAVDYQCTIFINEHRVIEHEGGQSSFTADITHYVVCGTENSITVKVSDDHYDMEQPRGKQYWKEEPKSIFYMHSVGIWQSVWLEFVPESYISSVRITPLFDEKAVKFDYQIVGDTELYFDTELFFKELSLASISIKTNGLKGSFKILLQDTAKKHWNFSEDLAWSPEHPRLFDVKFQLKTHDETVDEVTSYFGMRKVSIENGVFMLNNRPYYQKLVLDQGYWPESLMTAPSDESFIEDIKLTRQMGFNGVRKHQKVEDPRYLYHADRLGLLVWEEMSSAFNYSITYASRMYREWMEIIVRDYNHPCIVVWTPLNESWGIQEISNSKEQQAHCLAMFNITKSIDPTRPVIDNDGWEHVCGDIWTVHDYEGNPEIFSKHYASLDALKDFKPAGKDHYVNGYTPGLHPIMVTEFGGIKYSAEQHDSHDKNWGYTTVRTEDDLTSIITLLFRTLQNSKSIQGYCYTQLTDVATETNGLLDQKRRPKVPVEAIRSINEGQK